MLDADKFKNLIKLRTFNYSYVSDNYDKAELSKDSDFKWFYNQFSTEYKKDKENTLQQWSEGRYSSDIEGCNFIKYYDLQGNHGYECPAHLCYPTKELKFFFSDIEGIKFADIDYYSSVIDDTALLKTFLKAIGVHTCVEPYERIIRKNEIAERNLPVSYSGRDHKWREKSIVGCHEMLKTIFKTGSKEISVKLWNVLCELCEKGLLCDWESGGKYSYFYYRERVEYFEPLDLHWLRNKKWLLNRYGTFVSPTELKPSDLAEGYKTVGAGEFFHLLGIK